MSSSATKTPKMLGNRAINRKIKMEAAQKIQAFWRKNKWRIYQEEPEEADDYSTHGCDCGDWLCPGHEEIFISCRICGSNCADGDWEREAFCSRYCMVYSHRSYWR